MHRELLSLLLSAVSAALRSILARELRVEEHVRIDYESKLLPPL